MLSTGVICFYDFDLTARISSHEMAHNFGNVEFCPGNYCKQDTEVCGDEKAFCYHGSCKKQNVSVEKCKEDGSKCREGKMCVSRNCVSIKTLRREGKVKVCQHDCNKRGVCNNMGHCHCDEGFAPPNCDSPGTGGSMDLRPASKPTGNTIQNSYKPSKFNDAFPIFPDYLDLVLNVFLLAVVPFTLTSLIVVYLLKLNGWFMSQSEYE